MCGALPRVERRKEKLQWQHRKKPHTYTLEPLLISLTISLSISAPPMRLCRDSNKKSSR